MRITAMHDAESERIK